MFHLTQVCWCFWQFTLIRVLSLNVCWVYCCVVCVYRVWCGRFWWQWSLCFQTGSQRWLYRQRCFQNELQNPAELWDVGAHGRLQPHAHCGIIQRETFTSTQKRYKFSRFIWGFHLRCFVFMTDTILCSIKAFIYSSLYADETDYRIMILKMNVRFKRCT